MTVLPSSRNTLAAIAFHLLVALPFCTSSIGSAASLSDMPDRTFVTDGEVRAIVRVDDTIYIGGLFSKVGPRTGPGVEVALDGSLNADLPEVSGAGPSFFIGAGNGVRAVAADGAGGWYIGGRFSHVGGIARTNLAHILADHSVDANFNPPIDGMVDALAISGPTIYVAGNFATIDGQTRNNIAALNTADGSVTAFNPNADGEVLTLAVSDDGSIVYAGGSGFTTIGGQPRAALAALDATTGTATATFDPSPAGFSGAANVYALAVSGSTLYVAGTFVSIGGSPRASIAALSLGGATDGVAVAAFDPSPSYFGCSFCSSIVALAVSGSIVYAGGSFDTMAGQPRNNLAGLNMADGSVTAFDPNPDANILGLAAAGGTVYVGGGFRTIGGQTRHYIAALDAADGAASGFAPETNGSVSTIAVSASGVYLGGLFSSLGGITRNSMAAINAVDGTATSWDPNPQGSNGGGATINTLAVSGPVMYVGGYFTEIDGQPRNNIAAINVADGIATGWTPNADGVVTSIAVSADTVYVGGSFLHIGTGGDQRIFLAAVNASDGATTSWDPNPDSDIGAVAVSGDVVYVGGHFLHVGTNALTRACIAAINMSDGSATDWDADAGPGCGVLALAVAGSTVYAGGNFTSMHGAPRNNIAAVNASDGAVTDFDPNASDGSVEAIAVDGSTVYAGGRFTLIGGQPRGMVAALNAGDGSATDFNPSASGTAVYALAVASDGTLYVGGSFSTFELAYQATFASFTPAIKNDEIFRDGFEQP